MNPEDLEDLMMWLRVNHIHAFEPLDPESRARFHKTFESEPWLASPELDRYLRSHDFRRFDMDPLARRRSLGEDARFVCRYYRRAYTGIWPLPVCDALWVRDPSELDELDVNALLRFLELDPMAFGTGYAKTRAIVRLGRVQLNEAQQDRVFGVLKEIVMSGWGKQVAGWRRLARMVPRAQVLELIRESDATKVPAVRKRAIQLYFALEPNQMREAGTSDFQLTNRYPDARVDWRDLLNFVREKTREDPAFNG